MRKFLLCILSAIFSITILFSNFALNGKITASATCLNSVSYSDYVADLQPILTDFCSSYKTRIAGSSNEAEAATFIKNYLTTNAGGVTAKNNTSTQNGIQNFSFVSAYTDTYLNSQNVIFEYKSSSQTDKKIVICCNYDAPVTYDNEKQEYVSFNNDALNASAASVASILIFAKNIAQYNLKFNVEFVFFGAGESSFAGSEFYLNGLSDEDAKNIMCVINVDKIALGDNLYFYSDEIETKFSKYVKKVTSSCAKEVDLLHLNKIEGYSNDLGLSYSHIALNSDNIKFMKRGIATLNLFAGDYESGIKIGLNEYNNKSVVTYTQNDTVQYINNTYGNEVILKNLFKTNTFLETLLCDSSFLLNTKDSYGSTSWFYNIFANSKLASYLTVVAFFVIIIIAMRIYLNLTVKSYYANVDVEFLSSVVKISDHVDGSGEDKNVPKVVGQVIANDIKKDKTLKQEKKKKDK